LNSGDNFLAGTTFEASRQEGAPFYDARFVKMLRYDALAIGNHEFDFGPEVFAEFVEGVQRKKKTTRFVSANLDYSAEPSLAPFIGEELVGSTIIHEKGHKIGVVGLTTDSLPSISSPGFVEVSSELAALAQAQIDRVIDKGAKIVILVSHLQGLESEIALVAELRGVDVVIGGGGDEILADESTQLVPGDEDDIFGEYPQMATSADGIEVPVVTTPGNYRYVGVLEVTFDIWGNVTKIDTEDSGIKVVTDTGPEAVKKAKKVKRRIERPVAAFVEDLATTVVGTSEVDLDCERTEVRGVESNCANLIADAHLATGVANAPGLGLDVPQFALQNGGGIRGEIDQAVGPISIADTFRLQPFGNFVAIAEDVPAEAVRQIIEEGAIRLPASGDGGFTHVSDGTTVVIDSSFPARDADQNTGEEIAPGQRVRELVLADGTVVVTGGVTQDVTVDLVQLNFSIGGGDAQPDLTDIPGVTVTILPVSDQQSLQNYIEDNLGGVVSAADYARGGEGRLTIS
jgi:5'-nucleotidase